MVRNKDTSIDVSVNALISYEVIFLFSDSTLTDSQRLLKRRQICGSRGCAESTAYLLQRVTESFHLGDVSKLLETVQQIGQRLIAAQPRELTVGNVIRRVLGLIREELEEDREGEASAHSENTSETQHHLARDRLAVPTLDPTSAKQHSSNTLRYDVQSKDDFAPGHGSNKRPRVPGTQPATKDTSTPFNTSMFSLLSHPLSNLVSPNITPLSQSTSGQSPLSSQALANLNATKDLRAEVVEGIEELLDEIRQADEQIAGYALEHIHSNEIILTYSSSKTIEKFLLKAAAKRRFTVVQAEGFPNNHGVTYDKIVGRPKSSSKGQSSDQFTKTLTAAGITVILVPDSAVFALMARINKVVLDSHVVLSNGGFVATSGTKTIVQAAKVHRTPVIVLSGVYKISPVYPFDTGSLMEDGDPSRVIPYEDEDFWGNVEVQNPLFDYVPADLVDLHITNLGGFATHSVQRIVNDHYRDEDLDLDTAKIP